MQSHACVVSKMTLELMLTEKYPLNNTNLLFPMHQPFSSDSTSPNFNKRPTRV
jgi:hypothetical protein